MPTQQHRLIEVAKFSYSQLWKAFETKMIERHGEEQSEAFKSSSDKESLSRKNFMLERKLNPEIINELENIREQEQNIERKKFFTKDTKLQIILQNLKQ